MRLLSPPKRPKSPPLAHMDVDIEIDRTDAGLLGAMRAALVPAAVAQAGIAHIGEPQAAPLRQPARALAGELPGKDDLFAILVGADDVRAQFAETAVIAADHLLLGEDGVAEEDVGSAGHRTIAI